MNGIHTLVPGFERALSRAPQAKRIWESLGSAGSLDLRQRALVGLVVAGRVGGDYGRWVMSRLARGNGLAEEEIFLATIGTAHDALDRHLAQVTLRALATHAPATTQPEDGILRCVQGAIAQAVLTCRVLDSIAPASLRAGTPEHRGRLT